MIAIYCFASLEIEAKIIEGIQESHMIAKNCNRDTAWFRIVEDEWPEVKQNLEKLLY